MNAIAREIAQELPTMRRYARAVLGAQAAGDASVRRCLENLLDKDDPFEGQTARLALFKALDASLRQAMRYGAELAQPSPSAPIENGSILIRRINDLDHGARRLLILTVLEGFTLGQGAEIVGMEPAEAAKALDRAKRHLREQPATRILIIEDEPIIALDIAETVERHGHEVVGIAQTHAEAVELARRGRPGLVLADIQLADSSSGLEAVQEILREIKVPVIFITAYPERLLTGERPEPTFLITKPFDHETIAVSIAQALQTASVPAP